MSSKAGSTALKRSLTDVYVAFCEEFQSRRFNAAANGGANIPLEDEAYGDDVGMMPGQTLRSRESINLAMAPTWLNLVKPIEKKLENIENDLIAFSRKLEQGDSFGLSRKEEQEVLMSRSRKITIAFKNAKMDIASLNRYTDVKPQEAYMRKNIISLLVMRLQGQMNRLSKLQFLHQEKLTVRKPTTGFAPPIKLSPGSMRPIGMDVEEDEEDTDEAGMFARYDVGFTQEQQNKVELSRIQIEQREQQIGEIAMQVEELATMFNEIAQLIHNQGSLLDRIDYNIDNADHSITKAQGDLRSVVRKERGFSKCLCCLLVSVTVAGTVVTILVGRR